MNEEWFEEIEFSYTNRDGDVIRHSIEREGGIHLAEVDQVYELFLRGIGFSVKEED